MIWFVGGEGEVGHLVEKEEWEKDEKREEAISSGAEQLVGPSEVAGHRLLLLEQDGQHLDAEVLVRLLRRSLPVQVSEAPVCLASEGEVFRGLQLHAEVLRVVEEVVIQNHSKEVQVFLASCLTHRLAESVHLFLAEEDLHIHLVDRPSYHRHHHHHRFLFQL